MNVAKIDMYDETLMACTKSVFWFARDDIEGKIGRFSLRLRLLVLGEKTGIKNAVFFFLECMILYDSIGVRYLHTGIILERPCLKE